MLKGCAVRRSDWLAVLAALGLAASSCANAQEFQVFEHDMGSVEIASDRPARFDVRAPTVSCPRGQSLGIDRSFKETLYQPLIRRAEARYRLPPRLLQALVWKESRFNPMAISPAGAAGLAQLMPATARELGVTNRHDPVQNIDGGARYLRQMLDKFGSIHLALAAYNAGPGAVRKAGGIPRNRETPNYVKRVLERWMAYSGI